MSLTAFSHYACSRALGRRRRPIGGWRRPYGGGIGGGQLQQGEHFSSGGGFGSGSGFAAGTSAAALRRLHHRFRGGGFGFWPYDDDYGYAYGDCYQTQRYHTPTGWHTRQVYVCS